MIGWIRKIGRKLGRAFSAFTDDELPTFSSLAINLSRDQLKRKCRILFIDDERVELIDDLKKEGFSVDQDFKGDDISHIERGYFDLVVLDYKGVGKKYGSDDGLALLKAIKRVNPSVFVLAYTSQYLAPNKSSEFYTLSDGNLNKDEGVANSIARIEEALRAAMKPERLWKGILRSRCIEPGTEKAENLEKRVIKAVLNAKKEEALSALGEDQGSIGGSLASSLIEKLISFAIDRAFEAYGRV